MAQPIPLEVPPRNPRAELRFRLEQAPEEHAEEESSVRRQRAPSDSCRSVSSISISNITDATRSSIIDS